MKISVWHYQKKIKKNPLCQNECLNLLNRSWLFWSLLPVLCYCHVIMVINTIIAVLNYQISTSKIAMESNLFLALNCHTWIYMLGLSVVKNLFRTLHDWSWNMWSKSYQIPCQVITKWMTMWLQMTVCGLGFPTTGTLLLIILILWCSWEGNFIVLM